MNVLLSALIGLFFGWINALIASRKGRDPLIWFVLGIIFALASLIVLVLLPPVRTKKKVSRDQSFVGTTIDVTPLGKKGDVITTELVLDSVEDQNWYYLDERRQQKGPITFGQLKDLFKQGLVVDNTYLWSEGMPQWVELSQLDVLSYRLQK